MPEPSNVPGPATAPVAPDAVRVWCGFRRSPLDAKEFFGKLGSIFIPATVQIQSPVGLTAYLPTVLPQDRPEGVPDEIALVFYEYQKAYDEAKQTVGGRAYGDLHGLVFDMDESRTGFPQRFVGEVVSDKRYHLFDEHVDWQIGHVEVFVGVRPGGDAEEFLGDIAQWLRGVQGSGEEAPNGAIVAATSNYVVYWEHWLNEVDARHSRITRLAHCVKTVYHQSIAPFVMLKGLWDVYPGVEVRGGESFNFQFPRHPKSQSLGR